MKANIIKASSLPYGKTTIIEINTLEDLIKLIQKEGAIIIDGLDNENHILDITIYDDYIE